MGCHVNIAAIQNGIFIYRMNHNKLWPADLDTLRREGFTDPNNPPFWCPNASRPSDPNTTPPDYFYLAPEKPKPDPHIVPNTDPNTLILCELPNPHPEQGRAVTFAGERCDFLTDKQLEAELAKPHNARFTAAYRKALKDFKPR